MRETKVQISDYLRVLDTGYLRRLIDYYTFWIFFFFGSI